MHVVSVTRYHLAHRSTSLRSVACRGYEGIVDYTLAVQMPQYMQLREYLMRCVCVFVTMH